MSIDTWCWSTAVVARSVQSLPIFVPRSKWFTRLRAIEASEHSSPLNTRVIYRDIKTVIKAWSYLYVITSIPWKTKQSSYCLRIFPPIQSGLYALKNSPTGYLSSSPYYYYKLFVLRLTTQFWRSYLSLIPGSSRTWVSIFSSPRKGVWPLHREIHREIHRSSAEQRKKKDSHAKLDLFMSMLSSWYIIVFLCRYIPSIWWRIIDLVCFVHTLIRIALSSAAGQDTVIPLWPEVRWC